MNNKKIALEICDRILRMNLRKTDPFTIQGLATNLLRQVDALGHSSKSVADLRYTVGKELSMALDVIEEDRSIFYSAISLIAYFGWSDPSNSDWSDPCVSAF